MGRERFEFRVSSCEVLFEWADAPTGRILSVFLPTIFLPSGHLHGVLILGTLGDDIDGLV